MKRRNKIYRYMTAVLLLIYIVLLTILYLSEYAEQEATIRSFGDAFWYSLVTLTTVGYGDLTSGRRRISLAVRRHYDDLVRGCNLFYYQ